MIERQNYAPTADLDELAEFILIGQTDAALQLLHDLFPDRAPWPHQIKRRVADRNAVAATRAL